MPTSLAERLLAANPGASCEDRAELEHVLSRALQHAREAHPAVEVAPVDFASFVGARLGSGEPALRGLQALRLDDLYLACACARGDRAAILAVERSCFKEIDAAVGRLGASGGLADELKQVLRERLFVGTSERPPRIAEYAGRSRLARWVHAIATRAAIDTLRRSSKEVSAGDALLDRALPAGNPELELLKERYSADFRQAVRDAIAELAADARNDLRFYYVDGLTLDQLAAMHRVTASAVSRRLAKSRQAILDRTRANLAERLRVSEEDVLSILRLIGSRLELETSVLSPR